MINSVVLKPSFHPPKPQSIRTISDRDRIDLLVRMNHFQDQSDKDLKEDDFVTDPSKKSSRINVYNRQQQSSTSQSSNAATSHEGVSTGHDVDSFFEALNSNKTSKPTISKVTSSPKRTIPKHSSPIKPHRQNANISHEETTAHHHRYSSTDFEGLSSFARNVGSSPKGLQIFLNKIRDPQSVCAVSLLWMDLTSNHTGTTTKKCVPSARCTLWYCTCDRTVRAGVAYQDPLAALVTFADEVDVLYMLPLLSSMDSVGGHGTSTSSQQNSRSQSQSSSSNGGDGNNNTNRVIDLSDDSAYVTAHKLPIKSTVPVTSLWHALFELIFRAPCRTVVYRSELVYLALLGAQQRATNAGVSFDAHLRLEDRNQFVQRSKQRQTEVTALSPEQSPGGVIDPRIAAYLCKSDISEQQLELEALCGLFAAHLVSFKSSSFCPIDHSIVGKVSLVIGETFMQLRSVMRMMMVLERQMENMSLISVFREIEMPITFLLAQMEFDGICLSQSLLDQTSLAVKNQIANVTEQVTILTGESPNLASPDQVAALLFDTLGLPSSLSNTSAQPGRSSPNASRNPTTATGKRPRHASTAEEDLLRIRTLHPVVDLILSFRTLSKFLSTYVEGLRPFFISFTPEILLTNSDVHNEDDTELLTAYEVIMRNQAAHSSSSAHSHSIMRTAIKIHSVWNQTVVRTGRLSCCRPNLQSAPNTHKVDGYELNCREFFVASTGCILVGADYSQIEVRLLAHLTNDPALLELFRSAGDVYKNMAGVIFHKEPSQVESKERDKAKTICLGVIYGMGVPSIANRLGITNAEATTVMNSFFDRFQSIQPWIAQVKSNAKSNGYVSTICGRRRYLESISSSENAQRAASERQAVNSIIQGSASDVIKLAMILVHHRIKSQKIESSTVSTTNNTTSMNVSSRTKLLMQIHDELIYEVPIPSNTPNPVTCSAVQAFVQSLRNVMEVDVAALLSLTVPVPVQINTGLDWGHMLTV